MSPRPPTDNRLLASLNAADRARLEPHLEFVALHVREVLEHPNRPITYVHFPLSGVASVIANAPEYRLEVGIIGREGMTGISIILGAEDSPHECFIQIAGESLRIDVAELKQALAERPSLQARCLLYVRAFLLQTAETALANGRCTIEERLARWLLMSHDRLDGDDVPITHEFLSLMLGVRRPGVTVALQNLEGSKVIRNTRGLVTIIDREEMEQIAGGAYSTPPNR